MYRPVPSARDRAATIALVALVHAALFFALLNLGGAAVLRDLQERTQLIDIGIEPPPPPVVELEPERERMPEEEGEASPENIKSTATPVTAPKPRIELPVPPPMPVADTPNIGPDPTQGAAPVTGPGTGAGGTGTGTGAGGTGSGPGGGGTGQATRPVMITPTLVARDYPREVTRRWPRGARVFTKFQIDEAGRPFNCSIVRSSGDPAVDQWTCSLVVSKIRFRPALDERGRPTVTWFGYAQAPVNF